MNIFVELLITTLIAWGGWMTAAATQQNQPEKIVFFGDSITEAGDNPGGYISIMRDRLEERNIAGDYELIGEGIGGNKVYDLYLRMDEDVLVHNPDVVVIWIGINDVWHKKAGTGTDPDKFQQFYEAIIKKLQDRGIKVVLATPGVIGEKTDNLNEQDGDLNRYALMVRTLADDYSCKLIDFRTIFINYNDEHNIDNKEKGILTTDGVHLNDKGNELVAEKMLDALVGNR